MKLNADMVESFSGVYLSQRYDQPQPTPEFHREAWAIYCSDALAAAIAAPRNHAKSTALTHDFGLATVLFRAESYCIIVGASEEMAIEHLNDIANELRENEDIIRDFKIKEFVTEQKTDIIVECLDGYQFRFIARGAEQKIRGRKWHGKRPGLIIGDDLEDDEQVESRDRRRKFRRWFFRACKQALRDGGKIRVHGTILHEDSLLNHLIKNKSWASKLYKAHASSSDFSQILWPEKFPESRLRAIKKEFTDEGDSAGYSQEYLNDPKDDENRFLQKEWFHAMQEEDYEDPKVYFVGCDFAVSKADSANRTSFTVGGRALQNILHVVDEKVGRWDTSEWIDELFDVWFTYRPEMIFVEGGVIWQAIYPTIKSEMLARDAWLPLTVINPVKDKKSRGRSLQKRMKGGGMRFDKKASWYQEYEDELLDFTGESEAVLDDEFDSTAILSRGLEDYTKPEEDDYETEEETAFERMSQQLKQNSGRSLVTGY